MDYKGCFSPFPTNLDEIWVISTHASLCTQFSIGLLYTLLHLDFVWEHILQNKSLKTTQAGIHFMRISKQLRFKYALLESRQRRQVIKKSIYLAHTEEQNLIYLCTHLDWIAHFELI